LESCRVTANTLSAVITSIIQSLVEGPFKDILSSTFQS
jgi:hypothetical protein